MYKRKNDTHKHKHTHTSCIKKIGGVSIDLK